MFFTVIVLLCLLGIVWTIYRVVGQSDSKLSEKISLACLIVFFFLAPLIIARFRLVTDGAVFAFIQYMLFLGFTILCLFFCFIFVRDVIWGILLLKEHFSHTNQKDFAWYNPSAVAQTNRVLFIMAIAVCVYGLYAGLKTPDLKEVMIHTSLIKKPVTIVALSDLHLTRTTSKSRLSAIVARVNKLDADMIVLPGDTIDDDPLKIAPLLEKLSELNAKEGVYAVSGNHEFYVGHEASRRALESAGITYLFNQGVSLKNGVYLAGVPDMKQVKMISDTVDLAHTFKFSTNKEYKVLLSHQPALADRLASEQAPVNLQISGHTHGGQIFPAHIFAWIANHYLGGLYQVNNTNLYVSRGAGQWGPQVRVFAPSEISVIRLIPNENAMEPEMAQETTMSSSDNVMSVLSTPKVDAVPEITTEQLEVMMKVKPMSADEIAMENLKVSQREADEEALAETVSEEKTLALNEKIEVLKEVMTSSAEPVAQEDMIETQAQSSVAKTSEVQQPANETKEVVVEEIVSSTDKDFEEAKASLDEAFNQVQALQDLQSAHSEEKQVLSQQIKALQSEIIKVRTDANEVHLADQKVIQIQEKEIVLLKQENGALKNDVATLKNALSVKTQQLDAQTEKLAQTQKTAIDAVRIQKRLAKKVSILQKQLNAQHMTGVVDMAQVQDNAVAQQPTQIMAVVQPIQVPQPVIPSRVIKVEDKLQVFPHQDGRVTFKMTEYTTIDEGQYLRVTQNVASYTVSQLEARTITKEQVEKVLLDAIHKRK